MRKTVRAKTKTRATTRRARNRTERQPAVAPLIVNQRQLYFPGEDPFPKAQSDLFDRISDQYPVALAVLSRHGVITALTHRAAKLFGKGREEMVPKPLAQFLTPEATLRLFEFLDRCAAERQELAIELELQLPGGAKQPILMTGIARMGTVSSGPPPPYVHVMLFDLRTDIISGGPFTKQHFQRLLGAIDGIVWEAELPMRFTFVSERCEQVLGYPSQQWIGDAGFWERHIYHEDRDRVVRERHQAVQQGKAHSLEYRMVAADDRIVWVKDSAVVLKTEAARRKIVGIITDVTDLQVAKMQLGDMANNLEQTVQDRTDRLQQNIKAVEALCYGIAHDLRSPLRAIQNFLAILVSDYSAGFDAEAHGYAARVQKALLRMGELIEGVLSYGRLAHMQEDMVPVNVGSILHEVVSGAELEIKEKGAAVQLQPRYPTVLAHPYLLAQAFRNLLNNALKFVPVGTPPELSIAGSFRDDPRTGASSIRIGFSDNGIGIGREFHERIFNIFEKLHTPERYPGTGVGLALVKRAVEIMNGRVGVFSQPGEGSTFWIELPLAKE